MSSIVRVNRPHLVITLYIALALLVSLGWWAWGVPTLPAAPVSDNPLTADDGDPLQPVAYAPDETAGRSGLQSPLLPSNGGVTANYPLAPLTRPKASLHSLRRSLPPQPLPIPTPTHLTSPAPIAANGGVVAILMYHHIAVPPTNADAVRRDLSVLPASFAAQLDYLSGHGYHPITLARYVDWLTARQQGLAADPLPSKAIVLTFDDGYDDNYANAYPQLRAHGMVGTFFIISGKVGQPGYASWEQWRQMSAAGMDIESHTVNHLDLSTLSGVGLNYELAISKQMLEQQLGKPITLLCYPSGRYNPATIAAAQALGYRAATTTHYGWSFDGAAPFELPRIRIQEATTLAGFVSAVNTVIMARTGATHGRTSHPSGHPNGGGAATRSNSTHAANPLHHRG